MADRFIRLEVRCLKNQPAEGEYGGLEELIRPQANNHFVITIASDNELKPR
jgi:hypothetical protein